MQSLWPVPGEQPVDAVAWRPAHSLPATQRWLQGATRRPARAAPDRCRDWQTAGKQIGRELGVRYVLEGSVRRSGNQVRVSAQLIDAAADTHLWAERFDRDTGDLFALQNDITRQIAIALNSELVSAEAGRMTEHPDALDYILRARAASNKVATPDNLVQATDLFEHALALDPRSVEAQSLLALTLARHIAEHPQFSEQIRNLRQVRRLGRAARFDQRPGTNSGRSMPSSAAVPRSSSKDNAPRLSVIAPIFIALPSRGPRAPRRHAAGQNQAEHKQAAAPFRDPVRPRQPASRCSPLP
jgi:hypothetical protein